MSLNIKDERTHALVRELAQLTGSSQTAAVREAVEHRLAELSRDDEHRESGSRRRRAREIVEQFQADLTEDERHRMQRADDWLYNDLGLPR